MCILSFFIHAGKVLHLQQFFIHANLYAEIRKKEQQQTLPNSPFPNSPIPQC